MTPERDAVTRARVMLYRMVCGEFEVPSDLDDLLDAYAHAVHQQALAEVVAAVEGQRMEHTVQCVKDAEEFPYSPLDEVCTCFATSHNLALTQVSAALAALLEGGR